MRRSEIIEGVNQILTALSQSKIADSIRDSVRRGTKNRDTTELAASLQIYYRSSLSFNNAARQLIDILELQALENPQLWASLFSNTTDEEQVASHELFTDIRFALTHLPKIARLIGREYADSEVIASEPIISNGQEMKLLSVTIFEDNKKLSSPQRLINVLESVNIFYTACAYIHEESPDTLSVVACDSGSDKAFDFLGIAKLIECVSKLIVDMWDNVVYYREKKIETRLELVNKSLPIFEKLSELEKTQPELAERLRRNVADGVNKFIESGATIPQIDAHSTFNSRTLLSPKQKLLVGAPDELEGTYNTDHVQPNIPEYSEVDEIASLSPETLRKIAAMVKEMDENPSAQNDVSENLDNPTDNDQEPSEKSKRSARRNR